MIYARITPAAAGDWILDIVTTDEDGTVKATHFSDNLFDAGDDPRRAADNRLTQAGWIREADWERLGNWIVRVTR